MASYVNLYVDQYSYYETTIVVSGSDNVVLDLNNITITGQIKRSYKSSTSYNFNVNVLNPEGGEAIISLSSSTTSIMPVGRYVFDVFGTDNTEGKSFKIIEGILEILPSVTNV